MQKFAMLKKLVRILTTVFLVVFMENFKPNLFAAFVSRLGKSGAVYSVTVFIVRLSS
jgi:hypothetical protein